MCSTFLEKTEKEFLVGHFVVLKQRMSQQISEQVIGCQIDHLLAVDVHIKEKVFSEKFLFQLRLHASAN